MAETRILSRCKNNVHLDVTSTSVPLRTRIRLTNGHHRRRASLEIERDHASGGTHAISNVFLTRRLESHSTSTFASERKTDSKPIHEIDETRREDASILSALSAVSGWNPAA